ncbi:unnamed protein product [Caenorhabditis auriculariae]|uniref:C-type lectin domain-containing protein n=1 Tax=Caenorhabditis auriculariae TaxID=2777116 RepID=A0A8S1H694_9PELO|nr:unnamed protein product [Caenorhabditis auriculariae]
MPRPSRKQRASIANSQKRRKKVSLSKSVEFRVDTIENKEVTDTAQSKFEKLENGEDLRYDHAAATSPSTSLRKSKNLPAYDSNFPYSNYLKVQNTSIPRTHNDFLRKQADRVYYYESSESATLKELHNSFLALKKNVQELVKLLGVLKMESFSANSELEKKLERVHGEKEVLLKRLRMRMTTMLIDEENERLKKEVLMYRSVMDVRGAQIEGLREKLNGACEALQHVDNALKLQKASIKGLHDDYEELHAKYNTMAEQLQRKDWEIKNIRKELDVSKRDKKNIGRQLSRSQVKVKKLYGESPEMSDSSTSSETPKRKPLNIEQIVKIRKLIKRASVLACYPNEEDDGHNCYSFKSNPSSFSDAQSSCSYSGYNLVSIVNAFANNYVFLQAGTHFSTSIGRYWIGLSSDSSGRFQWQDGTTSTYRNWAAGEPRITQNACVQQDIGNGRWYTEDCGKRQSFVCWGPDGATPISTSTPYTTTSPSTGTQNTQTPSTTSPTWSTSTTSSTWSTSTTSPPWDVRFQ